MKKLQLLFLSLIISSSIFAQRNDFAIKLKSGDLNPSELNDQQTIGSVINSMNANGDYYIVQFDRIPDETQKQELNSNGIQLLEYLPEFSWLTNLSNANENATVGSLKIRSIVSYEPLHKYPDYFDLNTAPDYVFATSTKVRLVIDRQLDQSFTQFKAFAEANSLSIEEEGSMGEYLLIGINKDRIQWLEDQAIVKFIDYAPAPPEKEDDRGRSLHRGNMLDSDDPMGRNYTGDGVSITIADDDIIGPHIDFTGRVTQFTTTNNGQTHGDMTSGIAMGAGNLDPTIKGMATKAYLYYYNIGGYPHIAQAGTNYTTRGVVVTSTSYSEGCNAGYTTTTRDIDLQLNTYGSILHVFSAGNSAGSTCGGNSYGAGTPWGTITGGRKQGKNVIATGNLDYRGVLTTSSSRGPARDGRIKPDICANGTNQMSTDPNNTYAPGGGTSAAAPGIAGIAAQIYEGYRDLNGNVDPPAGLIKAAMLNTARDIGNRGPDFFYGWGRVNAHRAMLLLEENRYINGSISQNGANTHTISLANSVEELKVMVYWTDRAASAGASKALINDMDIRVVTPNNDTLLPWILNSTPIASLLAQPATKGLDTRNNMEQVSIDTASAGTYTVLVNGSVIPQGPQSYHLVWETKTDSITVTYPAGGESFVPGEVETIRWDAEGTSGTFTIEYSTNNGASWTSAGVAGGTLRYRNWTVPNIASGDVLVRVSRSGNVTGVSRNNFSILRQPTGISVAYTCPDSVQLRWNPVTGATDYDIYQLGTRFMDSVGTTSADTFSLYNLNLADDNWWAIRARGAGIKGRRTIARLVPKTVQNCPIAYDFQINSFVEPSSDYVQNCGPSGKFPVRIQVKNNGDSVLSNIPVRLRAGNSVFLDTISGPILPNANQFFTFRDSVTASAPGNLVLSAIGDLSTDQNSINDSLSKTVQVVSSTVFTVPYNNDFETFNLCATTNNCGGTTCILNSGWTNVSNLIDNHDMRVDVGGTPSANTGPTTDHNPGTTTGKYIYAEASGGCVGSESQVLTPCFDLNNTINPEFSFWYNMNGAAMGTINLDILTPSGWVFNVMPTLFGNQGVNWQQRTVNLSSYVGQTISLRFRFVTGSSWTSDMAIDDVSVIDLGVGIQEIKTNEYRLYPNPTEGFFNIQLNEGKLGDIRVFDLQGRNVFTSYESSSSAEIDLSQLDKGIYIVEFNNGQREKIILQ